MPTVRLSDAVVPEVYRTYTAIDSPEKSELIAAGVMQRDPLFDQIARAGGITGTLPFWKDLDPNIEENQSNDDPADLAVPQKLGSGRMHYRKCFVNQSFAAMDLVAELTGSNPMQRIRNRFGVYWKRRDQRRLVATISGILADNIANDGGDMVIDISGNTGDDAFITAGAAIDAEYTMGDAAGAFVAMIVHSKVMADLEKRDLIATEKDSEGRNIRIYRGMRVIVDDGVPTTGTGANRVYTTIFFGGGAIGFGGVEGHEFALGEGVPENPVWVERVEQAGNGGGMETIGERRTIILHPFGFDWIEGTLVEFSPTNADLADASHWNRIVDRKQVPMAFLRTKAGVV